MLAKGDWTSLIQLYGFKDKAEAFAYRDNPIDTLAPLAKARGPSSMSWTTLRPSSISSSTTRRRSSCCSTSRECLQLSLPGFRQRTQPDNDLS